MGGYRKMMTFLYTFGVFLNAERKEMNKYKQCKAIVTDAQYFKLKIERPLEMFYYKTRHLLDFENCYQKIT